MLKPGVIIDQDYGLKPGVLPDSSPLLVGSARSAALAGADTVLLVGARSLSIIMELLS